MKHSIFICILFAMLLSACGNSQPTPTVTATSLPTNASIPTVIPTVTATSVPMIDVDGLQVPDPKVTNPEFFDLKNPDSPIVQFSNAFGIKPEDLVNLTPVLMTDANGKQVVLMTTSNIASNRIFDENGRALIIGEQGSDSNWSWHNYKDVLNGTLFGNQISIGTEIQPSSDSGDIQANNFNAGTITYVWARREPDQGSRDTSYIDRQLFLVKSGDIQTIRMSHIISNDSEPDWIKDIKTNAELEQVIKDQVDFIMQTYSPQGVTEFNVVNEPWLSDIFSQRLGRDQYVLTAFQEANRVRQELINQATANKLPIPVIKLGLSFADNESSHGEGYEPTMSLAKMLAQQGLIDYIDVHFHIKDATKLPSVTDIKSTLQGYGQIVNSTTQKPLEVVIGEMDIDITKLPESDKNRFIEQASIGESYFKSILNLGIKQITFWGAVDSDSWYVNGDLPTKEPYADALLYNDDGTPKPLAFALTDAVLETILK